MRRFTHASILALAVAMPGLGWAQDSIPASDEDVGAFILGNAEPVAEAAGDATDGTPDAAPDATVAATGDERVKELIVQTLTENPEILVEALNRINAQQVEAKAAIEAREARIRDIARNDIGAPVTGNPEGDVTIVLFTDYNCPHCRAAHDIIESVVAEDGKVRVVYREWPVLGPDSLLAAKAALAADIQGKYPAFHAALMGLTDPVDTQSLLRAALEAGVDINTMLVDQEKDTVIQQLEDTRAISEEFALTGTPSFFIGTTVASGAPTAADLRAAIEAERKRQIGG
jgi:protein-disulfide isomerase